MHEQHSKTIAVVLGTYNGEKYIAEQLESILDQSRRPDEIVVSDDRSQDSTLQISERVLKHTDVHVQIAQNVERLGFRENFLQACRRARSHYIAFCDQDDVWHKDKLAHCEPYLGRADVASIAHAAHLVDDNGRIIGEFRQGITKTVVRPPLSYDLWSTFWGFSLLFRRDLLDLVDTSARFIDYNEPGQRIAHDRWIGFLGQMVGATVEISEPLVAYRQHGKNLFGAPRQRNGLRNGMRARSEIYLKATREMLEILEAFPCDTNVKFPLFDRDQCRQFVQHSLAQLEARDAIYQSSSSLQAIVRLAHCFRGGHYRAIHDQQLRVKSVARDLIYSVLRA